MGAEGGGERERERQSGGVGSVGWERVWCARVGGRGESVAGRTCRRPTMSMRNRDRSAKVKVVVAGSDEEKGQKERIDKLQKEKQDLLDGEPRPRARAALRCAGVA